MSVSNFLAVDVVNARAVMISHLVPSYQIVRSEKTFIDISLSTVNKPNIFKFRSRSKVISSRS
jgi:hypothetical protein